MAAAVFAVHTGLAGTAIFCIWLFAQFFHSLWGTEEPLLFDVFPIRYLFDASDFGVVSAFSWFGVVSTYKTLKE